MISGKLPMCVTVWVKERIMLDTLFFETISTFSGETHNFAGSWKEAVSTETHVTPPDCYASWLSGSSLRT